MAAFSTQRLVLVTSAIEMLLGLAIYALPREFSSPLYIALQPLFPFIATSLLSGGVLLLLLARYSLSAWSRRLLFPAAAVPLLGLAVYFGFVAGWGGPILYGLLALAIAAAPWLTGPEAGETSGRTDLLALTFGLIQGVFGAVMIFYPAGLQAQAIQDPNAFPMAPVGVLGLVGAASLILPNSRGVWAAPDRGYRIWSALPLPLLLTFGALRVGAWTGPATWLLLVAALLAGPRFSLAPPAAPTVSVEHRLEMWSWLLVLAVAGLPLATGRGAVASGTTISLFVMAVSLYNVSLLTVFRGHGSEAQRTFLHLAFLTVAIGFLMSDGTVLGRSFLVLMAVTPLLALRSLGRIAGQRMLLLAITVLIGSGLRVWWIGAASPLAAVSHATVEALAVVIAVLGLGQEIMARQAAEAALRSSEERFRRIFDGSPAAIGITSLATGRFVLVNDRLVEVTGFERQEIIGRTTNDLNTWVDVSERQPTLDRIRQQRSIRGQESRLRVKSGATLDALVSFELIDFGGEECVVTLFLDITKRKQAEAELTVRVRQQAVVAELGQRALGGVDLLSLMDEATARTAQTLGVEYCGVLELLPSGKSLVLRAGVGWQAGLVGMATMQGDATTQAGVTLAGGQPVVVSDLSDETRFTVAPWMKQHGLVSGMSVVIAGPSRTFGVMGVHTGRKRNFTEDDVRFLQSVASVLALAWEKQQGEARIVALNAELEERVSQRTQELTAANRELEAFCYSVSHDLQAPLRGIDGFSRILLEDYAGAVLDETGQQHLHRVRAGSQRMARLIDDLLNLSRLTRNEVFRRSVDLSALVEQLLANVKAQEPQRQVTCVVQKGVTVTGDARLLSAAMKNLVENAWKFTSKRPSARIEFGTVEKDGEMAVFMADNGAGFDMAYADKLYVPFQRLHSPNEFEGNGVGLATVARIVQRHGGRIWAESRVDQGATFYFTLPSSGPGKARPPAG